MVHAALELAGEGSVERKKILKNLISYKVSRYARMHEKGHTINCNMLIL
jgi:hypothetical protein